MTVIAQYIYLFLACPGRGAVLTCARTLLADMERKKTNGSAVDGVTFRGVIEEQLSEAKAEMAEEIRSGVSGELLKEDELTGTPNKDRKPPKKNNRGCRKRGKVRKVVQRNRSRGKPRETPAVGVMILMTSLLRHPVLAHTPKNRWGSSKQHQAGSTSRF